MKAKMFVVAVMAFALGMIAQHINDRDGRVAYAQVRREDGYQVDLWFLAQAKGGYTSLDTFYYADDVMRCVIFSYASTGIAPVCFPRNSQ